MLCWGRAAEPPPRSPPPACRARGQLGFRSPFCRQGWYVHHKLWTAWLPLTVNVSELFWAGRLQSRRQQTGRVLLAPPPAAGVSCFQRALGFPSTDPPRARPRHQHDAAVPGFPHLPGLPQCLGEGRSTCHHPRALPRGAQGSWRGRILGHTVMPAQSHKLPPNHPLAAAFSHHCPPAISSSRGTGGFFCFLGTV